MKEKLIIRNFGPIKEVELELGRFTVLIGEQATGKSTVAKVLAVCRYFSYILNPLPELNAEYFLGGLKDWGLDDSIKSDSFFYYENNHYKLIVGQPTIPIGNNYEDSELIPTLVAKSDEFEALLTELYMLNPAFNPSNFMEKKTDFDIENWRIPYSFFKNDVSKVLDNPLYIPIERSLQSIFSLGKSSIQNISDSLFNQLAKLDFISKKFTKDIEIEPLKIQYKNVDGRGFVRKNDDDSFYGLVNGASGYQSTIPVVLLIKYYTEHEKKAKTFLIEEPELNLFPTAQNKLVEFLSENVSQNGHSFFINTHSPYVLTSLNNLIYAYNVGKEHGEETSKIIDKKSWLNPDEVSAYMLLPDGTCEDIFDRGEGLIKADKIDQISGILNKQFDSLINVELSLHEQD